MSESIDRRVVLKAGGLVAAGATLAACGSSSSAAGSSTSTSAPTVDSATTFNAIGGASVVNSGATTPPSAADSAASNGAAAANTLGNASAIAVGGGAIFPDSKVVVTQPTAGQYKAFTAVCTHQGCIVSNVDATSGTIICPCHGSTYSVKDGSVINGPATQPLAAEKITVTAGVIKLG